MDKQVENEARLKSLKRQRSRIKGSLTVFKNHLESFSKIEVKDVTPLQLRELELKLANINKLSTRFDDIQSEIEISVDDAEVDNEVEQRDKIESIFCNLIGSAQTTIESHKEGDSFSSAASGISRNKANDATAMRINHIKLPTIKLPTFDGNHLKWLEFRDIFDSLINKNDDIPAISKYQYLRSALEGGAAVVLRSIEFSAQHYETAWEVLCERYNNTRILVNNHIKSLYSLEPFTKESFKMLRYMIDHITKNLRALNTLEEPTEHWDTLIIFSMSAKLDPTTGRKWEEYKGRLDASRPSLEEFYSFLRNRADMLEIMYCKDTTKSDNNKGQSKPNANSNTNKQASQARSFVASSAPNRSPVVHVCDLCSQGHRLYECAKFKEMTPQVRLQEVQRMKLCVNCLRSDDHSLEKCRRGPCTTCKEKHNTLVCSKQTNHNLGNTNLCTGDSARQNDSHTLCVSVPIALSATLPGQVLLCTASVEVVDPDTNVSYCARALLDSGSQSSFITKNLKQRLQIKTSNTGTVSISGINNSNCSASQTCELKIKSRLNDFCVEVSCLVIPQITGSLPTVEIDAKQMNVPTNIQLADPNYYRPSEIEILLGADVFWDVVEPSQIKLGRNKPTLKQSKFGWLISGPIGESTQRTKQIMCNFSQEISEALARFWELEELPSSKKLLSKDEEYCEQHFQQNVSRLPDGRFSVKMPLKELPQVALGDSYQIAKRRFLSVERRLLKNPELRRMYSDFIHEYEDMGHLRKIEFPKLGCFLPHHAVIRQQSETTKLRVVFDASCKTRSGKSLNDVQAIGPVVQDDLFSILVRFRQGAFVVTGDVEKMYRQIMIDEEQRNLQLILWRDDDREPLSILQLNTVTYGTASAPFLATRCLHELGKNCDDQIIGKVIKHDFYVDDLITTADTKEELKYIVKGVIEKLNEAKLPLRKFRTNALEIFDEIPTVNQSQDFSKECAVLGLGWAPITDTLQFSDDGEAAPEITKRSILSKTCKIFDPLGLLSACTIVPKILLQKLWLAKLDWDDKVPENIRNAWVGYSESTKMFSHIKIPRYALIGNPVMIELHCYSDASQGAYAACLYLRSADKTNHVTIHLMCAKARVAPLKPTTIPRLELCAALLGARLHEKVSKSLRITISRSIFWTDSTIVLGWIKTQPITLKAFVCNRVQEIRDLSPQTSWRHVPTDKNPADLASRGIKPDALLNNYLWWTGPPFLKQDEEEWPAQTYSIEEQLPETKVSLNTQLVETNNVIEFDRYSDLSKLQRIMAYVLRFINNCNSKHDKSKDVLTVSELDIALNKLAQLSQRETFAEEIDSLTTNKSLKSRARILSLSPFIDEMGLLRVGGRLQESQCQYDKMHPILIDSKHKLAKLIFEREHRRLFHCGPQQLLHVVRDSFWPTGGRLLSRATCNRCTRCVRMRGKTLQPIMGNLPEPRVTPAPPFESCGTDFGGPFLISSRKGRGSKTSKCYLCLFVCLSTRALHLEVVSGLSTNDFILSLRRFISRRGKPKVIWCDNGSNFVGTNNELQRMLRSSRQSVGEFASGEGIKFKFNPAYAPNFGGIWESGIKAAKFHLNRIAGNCSLTFEELTTLFTQIEAILNSRPLTPMSSDPLDLRPLTPGHFLIGRSLIGLPSPSTSRLRLNRYDQIERLRQGFWERWHKEVLQELQQRVKWRRHQRQLEVGELVLVKEEQLPAMQWCLGRITKLFAGGDGVCRVADVLTKKGTIRRAIAKLCPLSLES